MEKETKVKFHVIAIILIIVFSFAVSPITLQNDTFYTVKLGEYVTNHGITMQDPFSWHENLNYTYPHWAYDVMTYFIYHLGGFLGIYISTIAFCAILGIIMYLTSNKLNKNSLTSFAFTIGAIYCLRDFVTARAQLFTFILFAITIYCIEQFLNTKKKRYAIGLIIIPITIANFHLAVFPFYFILYLPYIAEYLIAILPDIYYFLKKQKIKIQMFLNSRKLSIKENLKIKLEELKQKIEKNKTNTKKEPYKIIINKNNNVKYLIIIMIIALFAGFLTPLGLTPYTYLYNTMSGNTTQNINEHLPLILINNIEFIVILILFLSILIFTDTKIRLSDLFMLRRIIVIIFIYKKTNFDVYNYMFLYIK